jgi:hypothetical protein
MQPQRCLGLDATSDTTGRSEILRINIRPSSRLLVVYLAVVYLAVFATDRNWCTSAILMMGSDMPAGV